MKRNRPQIYIGTSGWSYKHWIENFYPKELKPTEWLKHYANFFPTVEINSTFYHTPLLTTVKNWNATVPKNFTFSIKANRYITHRKRLHECEESLKIFYKSIKNLNSKTGPILFQLPPSFKMDLERLSAFIKLLDNKHLYTFEFRHSSWFTDEVYELLLKNQIALCITDLNGKLSPEVITSSFIYIRLHGPRHAYRGSYSLPELRSWKKKIEKWTQQTSVYCYFDNDEKGFAIKDAKTLLELLD